MSLQENEQLWGGETTKAIGNFPISGEPVPVPVVRWLGRIKGAAARVNAEISPTASRPRPTGLRAASLTISSRSTSSRPGRGPRPT